MPRRRLLESVGGDDATRGQRDTIPRLRATNAEVPDVAWSSLSTQDQIFWLFVTLLESEGRRQDKLTTKIADAAGALNGEFDPAPFREIQKMLGLTPKGDIGSSEAHTLLSLGMNEATYIAEARRNFVQLTTEIMKSMNESLKKVIESIGAR